MPLTRVWLGVRYSAGLGFAARRVVREMAKPRLVTPLSAAIARRARMARFGEEVQAVSGVADLDLSNTPPLGSPWDAVQIATQDWSLATADR